MKTKPNYPGKTVIIDECFVFVVMECVGQYFWDHLIGAPGEAGLQERKEMWVANVSGTLGGARAFLYDRGDRWLVGRYLMPGEPACLRSNGVVSAPPERYFK